MIQGCATNLATKMGIKLSRISVVEGRQVGCLDVFLLSLSSDDHHISTLVYQTELDHIQKDAGPGQIEIKIRSALERLKIQMKETADGINV